MLNMVFIAILGLNIIAIIQMSPWDFRHILPLYVPEAGGHLVRHQLAGTTSRTLGIMASPTSFSMILIIIITIIVSWMLYMPAGNNINSLLIKMLLILTFITLILTFSRTGFIALIMSQVYLLAIAKFKDKKNISKIIIPYFIVLGLIISSPLYLAKFNIPISSLRGLRILCRR